MWALLGRQTMSELERRLLPEDGAALPEGPDHMERGRSDAHGCRVAPGPCSFFVQFRCICSD